MIMQYPMPLPSFLVSANVLICERVLVETDNVLTAVRMVDVFILPKAPPEHAANLKDTDPIPPDVPIVQMWITANVKAIPGYSGSHSLQLKLIDTAGELSDLGEARVDSFRSLWPDAHPTFGTVVQLRVGAKRLGNCYVCLFVDEKEVARAPFTFTLPLESQG